MLQLDKVKEYDKPTKQNGFYLSKEWRKKREHILKRDKHLCQHCLKNGKVTAANTVHHIKELEEYPDLALTDSNLISLCFDCHELTKKKNKNQPNNVRIIKV